MAGRHAGGLQEVVFVFHFFVFHEGGIFDLWHAERIEQVGIGGNVHRFHVCKRTEHHLNLNGAKDAGVMFHVTIIDLNIRLGKETENLGHQIFFGLGQGLFPVTNIFGQGHFLWQPVNALLGQPCFITPRIQKWFIDVTFHQ